MIKDRFDRRTLLRAAASTAFFGPLLGEILERPARAAGSGARRAIFFYFPDGVAGPGQDGSPSLWHPTGDERNFQLTEQLSPLERHRNRCLFFSGLSMGPTDVGSHPGGAKKLLTAADGGNGESIDQLLARTVGASAPHRHLYLGAMANLDNASGDKHISYPSAGQSTPPEDNPRRAFERLFGQASGAGGSGRGSGPSNEASVIDAVLDDLLALKGRLGAVEANKLDLHLTALREVEARIRGSGSNEQPPPESCQNPRGPAPDFAAGGLHAPERFPEILRLQTDLLVTAMACGLTRVGTIQASHHTSNLLMNRFAGTEMADGGSDMGSHHASHYGATHDLSRRELAQYVRQRKWFVEQFAYLLDALAARPEDGGTMLDHSVVLLCTEVCDGNTHLHDDMPFVLAGGAGGAIETGRFLRYGGDRHAGLFTSIAQAMGANVSNFGDTWSGPLWGVLR